jgi:hypothetical protein
LFLFFVVIAAEIRDKSSQLIARRMSFDAILAVNSLGFWPAPAERLAPQPASGLRPGRQPRSLAPDTSDTP